MTDAMPPHAPNFLQETQCWIEQLVIKLNLCPFASKVYKKQQIRYVLSEATTENALLTVLGEELVHLKQTPAKDIDTTLIIHPFVLNEFLTFNDFLDQSDALISHLALDGIFQIASFHPHYQFAGTSIDDPENYTNRSPYPMLHLLREDSLQTAIENHYDVDAIPENNIETMKRLGSHDILERLRYCQTHK